jgi:hypothetical protein
MILFQVVGKKHKKRSYWFYLLAFWINLWSLVFIKIWLLFFQFIAWVNLEKLNYLRNKLAIRSLLLNLVLFYLLLLIHSFLRKLVERMLCRIVFFSYLLWILHLDLLILLVTKNLNCLLFLLWLSDSSKDLEIQLQWAPHIH